MGNKSIRLAEERLRASLTYEDTTQALHLENISERWSIVSAGGNSRPERFRQGGVQFAPINASTVDPAKVDEVCMCHSVGLHCVIMYKLKDGSRVLYASGSAVPFMQLPYEKPQEGTTDHMFPHLREDTTFQPLDISPIGNRTIRKVFCSFKQTFIITTDNKVYCSGIQVADAGMDVAQNVFVNVGYDENFKDRVIVKMEVMHFGMLFLTDDGELHCIQEYAAPRKWTGVKDFMAGAYFALIIFEDNTCTKWEIYKQYTKSSDSPLPCAYEDIYISASCRFMSCILTHDNRFFTNGTYVEDMADGDWHEHGVLEELKNQTIVKIVGCNDSILVLTVYGVGRNQSGCLGREGSIQSPIFERIEIENTDPSRVITDIEACYRTTLVLLNGIKPDPLLVKMIVAVQENQLTDILFVFKN